MAGEGFVCGGEGFAGGQAGFLVLYSLIISKIIYNVNPTGDNLHNSPARRSKNPKNLLFSSFFLLHAVIYTAII